MRRHIRYILLFGAVLNFLLTSKGMMASDTVAFTFLVFSPSSLSINIASMARDHEQVQCCHSLSEVRQKFISIASYLKQMSRLYSLIVLTFTSDDKFTQSHTWWTQTTAFRGFVISATSGPQKYKELLKHFNHCSGKQIMKSWNRICATYAFRTVFHSSFMMGLHGSGFPSFPILAATRMKQKHLCM